MKIYSLYDAVTGVFLGRRFGTDIADPKQHAAALAAHIPAGAAAIEGEHDHLATRVNVVTGVVEPFQPPPPSADYQWDEPSRRWVLSDAVKQRQAARSAALVRMAELERTQARPLRELFYEPQNAAARARLDAIEREIASLRAGLAS